MTRHRSKQLLLPIALGNQSSRRPGRLRRRLAWTGVASLLALVLGGLAFFEATRLRAPRDESPAPVLQARAPASGQLRLSVPGGTLSRRRGVQLLELSGTPRQMGLAHGALLAPEVGAALAGSRRLLGVRAEGGTGLWDRVRRRWYLRRLTSQLPADSLVELASLARATEPLGAAKLDFAALARSQALLELVEDGAPGSFSGTVSLAVWGKQTASGGLLLGRTFAVRHEERLDWPALISVCRPHTGSAYVGVGWPGMVGVLTGLNDRLLFIALNPAQSDDSIGEGLPAAMIAREVLRRAGSIREAVRIIKRLRPMGAFSALIADGKAPDAAVVEVMPGGIAVRRSERAGRATWIVATDHLRHRRHAGDATNERFRRYTSSAQRYQIAADLLRQLRGQLDAAAVLALLRDRSSRNGKALPLGHPGALDNARAVYGLVVDAKQLVMWVSRGPRLQGPLVAFDLAHLLGLEATRLSVPGDLPADPVLGTPEVERLRWGRAALRRARRHHRRGEIAAAIESAGRAVQVWGRAPQPHLQLGDLLWAEGQTERARSHYREYLRRHPADHDAVDRAIARLRPR